jgi:hypothetical protein
MFGIGMSIQQVTLTAQMAKLTEDFNRANDFETNKDNMSNFDQV